MLSQKQYDACLLWVRDELDVEPGRDFLTGTDSPMPAAKAAVVRARHMLDSEQDGSDDSDDTDTDDAARQIAAAITANSE